MKQETFNCQTGDGLRLFGRAWRPQGEARAAVCLVHGLGEHSGRYENLADALTAAGYAVLAFDLRGHGRSAGVRGHAPSYNHLLEDIGLLLAEAGRRFPARSRFLYGHSMGGNLVINYVLGRRPALAGVVAVAPALRLRMPPSRWKLLAARLLYRIWPWFPFPNGIDPQVCTQDPGVAREHLADPYGHSLVSARLGIDLLAAGPWALEHAADFTLPLLLMYGSRDLIIAPKAVRAFAGCVSGECTLKEWTGFCHELHSEPGREEVFTLLATWLEAHLPSS